MAKLNIVTIPDVKREYVVHDSNLYPLSSEFAVKVKCANGEEIEEVFVNDNNEAIGTYPCYFSPA